MVVDDGPVLAGLVRGLRERLPPLDPAVAVRGFLDALHVPPPEVVMPYHHLGELQQAIACYRRALDLVGHQGDRYREADVRTHLGDSYLAAGESGRARSTWQQALLIFTELGLPNADAVRAKLG
jgi:tetratricopeptide (TPR) repeat protein